MTSLTLLKQTRGQTLEVSQSIIVFYPYHLSSEDELKWINVSYKKKLVKKDVMSQMLNYMYGI